MHAVLFNLHARGVIPARGVIIYLLYSRAVGYTGDVELVEVNREVMTPRSNRGVITSLTACFITYRTLLSSLAV